MAVFYQYMGENYKNNAKRSCKMDKPAFGSDPSGGKDRYREAAIHGPPQFPMRIYENNFDWYANNIIDWHWHPEIEIAVVLSGRVMCCFNDAAVEVGEGEGFFLNSNTMHMERPLEGGEKPIMNTVCFMPEFVGDCGGDLIYRRYVAPIVTDVSLRGMKLSEQVPWQGAVLEAVRKLYLLSEKKERGYELKCRNIVGELWYQLAVNLRNSADEAPQTAEKGLSEKRLKKMLSYIHENYMSDLSVDDIAASASISKSECFRCFRNIIGKKPIGCLNDYRLKKAAELLAQTDMQITQICLACGFSHISYFGKVFRQQYGLSPKQFRELST